MTKPTDQPILDPRERRRMRTLASIEDAALRLFEAQGYEQTTVEQIAEGADISLRTFFRYFAAKDQTLFNSLPPTSRDVCSELATRPEDEDDWTKLRRAYVTIARRHDEAALNKIRARYRLIQRTPALYARHAEHTRLEQHEIVETLRHQRAGTAEEWPVALLVSMAYVTIWHALDRWIEHGAGGDLADVLDEMFEVAPRVLLADDGAAMQMYGRLGDV